MHQVCNLQLLIISKNAFIVCFLHNMHVHWSVSQHCVNRRPGTWISIDETCCVKLVRGFTQSWGNDQRMCWRYEGKVLETWYTRQNTFLDLKNTFIDFLVHHTLWSMSQPSVYHLTQLVIKTHDTQKRVTSFFGCFLLFNENALHMLVINVKNVSHLCPTVRHCRRLEIFNPSPERYLKRNQRETSWLMCDVSWMLLEAIFCRYSS